MEGLWLWDSSNGRLAAKTVSLVKGSNSTSEVTYSCLLIKIVYSEDELYAWETWKISEECTMTGIMNIYPRQVVEFPTCKLMNAIFIYRKNSS